MAGVGSNFVLDKGWKVLTTYNSSSTNGVTANRCVGFGAGGTIDLNATSTARSAGVVIEAIDRAKVATGDAVANVRMLGIAKVYVTTATSIVIGSLVAPSTSGGVILAASTHIPIGVVVGITGTVAAGDLIEVFVIPGLGPVV